MKLKLKNIKYFIIAIMCILIIPATLWSLWQKLEGKKPSVKLNPSSLIIGASHDLSVTVSDPRSGIRRIWIGLLKDGKEIVLREKSFSDSFIGTEDRHEETFYLKIEPRKMGITDGKAVLRIVARDCSWRDWGHGNKTYIENNVKIDTRSPQINVLSKTHNITQGGSGLVVYRLSEPCLKSGVYVGENFFPAYSAQQVIAKEKQPSDAANIFISLIALGYEQGAGTTMFVEATDLANNKGRSGFSYYIGKGKFRRDSLEISDRFLNLKLPEFDNEIDIDPQASPWDKFLIINGKLRKANEAKFIKLAKKTDTIFHWKGDFLRFPGKRMASFADHREYRYKGETKDEQVHMGVDIASVAQAPVPAANTGKVVFAGYIGIYGNTVMIDHGMGLFTTYSHLTDFNVNPEQMVSKNEIIGRTGITGLAGGDHLHFGMIVHNTFVNPLEWWDLHWIKNNILNKINEISN